jgi:hypothetical protein
VKKCKLRRVLRKASSGEPLPTSLSDMLGQKLRLLAGLRVGVTPTVPEWCSPTSDDEVRMGERAEHGGRPSITITSIRREPAATNGGAEKARLDAAKASRSLPRTWYAANVTLGAAASQRLPTCAVVGSDGALSGSGCGAQIDESDLVFRMNKAPAGGVFARDVGARTDVNVFNEFWLD